MVYLVYSTTGYYKVSQGILILIKLILNKESSRQCFSVPFIVKTTALTGEKNPVVFEGLLLQFFLLLGNKFFPVSVRFL